MNDKFILHNSRGFSEIGDKYSTYQQLLQIDRLLDVNNPQPTNNEILSGDHTGTDFYVKNSFKINIYDYPFLKKGVIYPFFHFSSYYLRSQKDSIASSNNFKDRLKRELRAAGGFGLAFEVGGGARVEILYNLFHYKQAADREARFQFKVSLDD